MHLYILGICNSVSMLNLVRLKRLSLNFLDVYFGETYRVNKIESKLWWHMTKIILLNFLKGFCYFRRLKLTCYIVREFLINESSEFSN